MSATAVSVTSPSSTTRIYTNSDNTTCTFTGGSRAWRNNNPGNIVYGTVAVNSGAIGKDANGFAIFPTYQQGQVGLNNVVTQTYGGSTINAMMASYAPSFENNTASYQAFLSKRIGVSGTTQISALTPAQLQALENGITTYEGTAPGKVSGKNCNADGAQPISSLDAPNSDGLDVAYSTDPSTGLFQINFLDGGTTVSKITNNLNGNFTNSVYDASGTTVIESIKDDLSSASTFTVVGSGFASNAGMNMTVTYTGSAINVNAGVGSNINIGVNGSTSDDKHIDTVTETNATVYLQSNTRANIFTDGGNVFSNSGDNFGVYGTGASVYGGGNTGIWIGANGKNGVAQELYDAYGATVQVVDNSNVDIYGGNFQGHIYAGTNDIINIGNGGQEQINLNGTGTLLNDRDMQDTIYDNGNGNRVNVYGNYNTTTNRGHLDQTNNFGSYDHVYNNGSNEVTWNSNSTDTSSGGTVVGVLVGGYYGYYGFAGNESTVATAVGSDIGSIASYDTAHGNSTGAEAANHARNKIQSEIGAGITSEVTGSRWDHNIITWSISDQGENSLGQAEEAAAQQAFSAWGAASGLNFVETTDSSKSDIKIGWGDFDTERTGVVGYTTYQSQNGYIQPGAVIRIEDQSEDALVRDTDGNLVFNGTQATFAQVLEHEIGHALGLASNVNGNSIESYYLGANNRTLSSADLETIQSIYGSPSQTSSISAELDQMTQAMASFAPSRGLNFDYAANDHEVFARPVLTANHYATQ